MSKVLVSSNLPIRLAPARIGAYAAAAFAALSIGVYVGATHLGATLRHAGATTDTAPIALRIGKHHFDIPANAIRFGEQRTTQPQGDVDLYLEWPSMLGFTDGARNVFHDPDANDLIFLRLTAADARPTEVEPPPTDETGGPAGLTRFRRPGLPGIASSEAVYRAPSDREPSYEANCLDGKDAVMAADCLRERQIGPGLRLRYRFAQALLPQWDRIDRAVLAYLDAHRRS